MAVGWASHHDTKENPNGNESRRGCQSAQGGLLFAIEGRGFFWQENVADRSDVSLEHWDALSLC